jgi:hypothetical protein
MYRDEELQNHLETSSTIKTQTAVIAEWNMNIAENILRAGNYRFRPKDSEPDNTIASDYRNAATFFDLNDYYYDIAQGRYLGPRNYTDATDSDISIDGGYRSIKNGPNLDKTPTIFQSKKQKESLLYSLEDCFGRFRPRSGINKLRYFPGKFTHFTDKDLAKRPRYYIADKEDTFKYWSSFRTEDQEERGISKLYIDKLNIASVVGNGTHVAYTTNSEHGLSENDIVNISGIDPISFNISDVTVAEVISPNTFRVASEAQGIYEGGGILDKTLDRYYIDDAVPYVVYKEKVPANRIVVKMQTNVGTMPSAEPFENINGFNLDPFYGYENQTTPVRWSIQYLQDNNWIDAITFDENSIRRNGEKIIGPDGFVEISYGLIVPEEYRDIFYPSGQYSSSGLPSAKGLDEGTAFLVKESSNDVGSYSIVIGGKYETFSAEYGWAINEPEASRLTNYVTDLTSPEKFFNPVEVLDEYREFQYLSGLRIVVETMNTLESTFDLIELSPRLVSDISDKVKSLSVKKMASDLGISGMPVGQLLASTGTLDLFDYDQAFFTENNNSIIKSLSSQNIQIKIYDIVVDVGGYDYYVPIKTMYIEGFPQVTNADRTVTFALRDMFFRLESLTAPQVLIQNASVSYAVSMLLDNIGFSNYTFLRVENENEMIIPYFSVGPDLSIAQVLNDIAVSSQSAMFFDEENNFVVMSKQYIMPSIGDREYDIDATLYGTKDFAHTDKTEDNQNATSKILQNRATKQKLANIVEISSNDSTVYNDGIISFTNRYIQKSYSSIKQASLIDKDRSWVYKPSLLWEVAGDEATKAQNEQVSMKSDYALAAVPLNSDLSSDLPSVKDHKLVDNTIDFGDGVYWLTRYNGYFYANSEIIRYDAIQYSVSGLNGTEGSDGNTVWITSLQEYQRYFAKISFNGKMYPTGLVRIFAEPNYETVNGITRLRNGEVAKHGRMQFGTGIRGKDKKTTPVAHKAGLSSEWYSDTNLRGCRMDSKYLLGSNFDQELGSVFSETIVRGTNILISNSEIKNQMIIKTINSEPTRFVSKKHGLKSGDTIKLRTSNTLPGQISEDFIYFVKNVLDVDTFTLSASVGGSEIIANPTPVQSGLHSFSRIMSELESYPARVLAYDHRLVPGDEIKFSTTGTLPAGVIAGQIYYVLQTSFTADGFIFSATDTANNSGVPVRLTGSGTGSHTLSANITVQDTDSLIKVLDATGINAGFTVEIVSGTGILQPNTVVQSVDLERNLIRITPPAISRLVKDVNDESGLPVNHSIRVSDRVLAVEAPAGIANDEAKTTTRNGIIKSFMSNSYTEESAVNKLLSTETGTVQSSAFIMQGSTVGIVDNNIDLISYVYKELDDKFVHFGTRMRIVGRIENSETRGQTPNGLTTYYTVESLTSDQPTAIGGASGGIGFFINPETNNGYYFEIAALTANNLTNYTNTDTINNVFFYKVMANTSATSAADKAIPIKLWGGNADILVDSGLFTSQNRMAAETQDTKYDLAVEYEKIGKKIRFYLFINNIQVATIDDDSPLDIYNNIALFTRGSSRVMFENVYALANNYTQNTTFSVGKLVDSAFGDSEISATNALQKYAMSGMIQSTYLSGISSLESPKYNLYFEEFGTIMREASYFDIRYDKAYPALYAKLAPTINKIKGYTVSGFIASAYGAEFLVFNNTDSALSLDSTSGNYLRILGVTFTQESQGELTVDQYYSKLSDFSNPQFYADQLIKSPQKVSEEFKDIRLSRLSNGRTEFSINASFIQSRDDAQELMSWLTSKIMQPRKSVGVNIFSMPTLQLGDIVNIDYKSENDVDEIASVDSRFVIYAIDYNKDAQGPSMTAYLSEVK